MSWDTWGIVKIKGDRIFLNNFIEKNKSLLDLTFTYKDFRCELLGTSISDQQINSDYIFWRFYTVKFDGESIIEHISKLYPELEFHSRFGSTEQSWFIECFIKNGITVDVYKVYRAIDDFNEDTQTVVENEINEEYLYEKIDWKNLEINWNHVALHDGITSIW